MLHTQSKDVPLIEWSELDVVDWLAHVGMTELVPVVAAHHIDGKTLSSLRPEDLKKLGITVIL